MMYFQNFFKKREPTPLRVEYEDLKLAGFDSGGGEILHYKGSPFTGFIVEYNENHILIWERQFRNGHKHGVDRSFFDNGQIEEESYSKFNTYYGLFREWGINGDLKTEYYWSDEFFLAVAIDVMYSEDSAKAVGIEFFTNEGQVLVTAEKITSPILPYEPGKFYKRELPCIMAVLKEIDLSHIEIIIVDGHVFTDNEGNYGLGGMLWETLKGTIPIIGVAKSRLSGNEQTVQEVYRGNSKSPLFVSSIGIGLNIAADIVRNMKGEHRIPDMLKLVDTKTRTESC